MTEISIPSIHTAIKRPPSAVAVVNTGNVNLVFTFESKFGVPNVIIDRPIASAPEFGGGVDMVASLETDVFLEAGDKLSELAEDFCFSNRDRNFKSKKFISR